MNARDNPPLRSKIAAHLDVVREADANAIGNAVGLSDRPSMVVKELNAMRTDGLIECEQRKKEMIYWLAVPVAQIDAESSSEAVSRTDRPDGIRAGTRAAQIWDALRDGAKLTAREIASMLQCANGAIDPVMSTLYKSGTVARTKGPDSVYRYHRPLEQPAEAPDSVVRKSLTTPQSEPVTPAPAAVPDISAHFNGFDVTKLPPILISCVARLWPGTEGMFWEQSLERMPDRIAEVVENMSALLAERAEMAKQFAVLKARHDDYERAIGEIHCTCADAGIRPGEVADRVRTLAFRVSSRGEDLDAIREALSPIESIIDPSDLSEIELARRAAATISTLCDTVHKITEGDSDAVNVLKAATGFVVLASKRKPRRITKPEAARDAALSAIRSGAQRAGVFALVPVGEARRGAEWMDA